MVYLTPAISPIGIIRGFYLVSTTFGILGNITPATKGLLSYGSRSLPSVDKSEGSKAKSPPADTKQLSPNVPHNWFTHFYVLSSIFSLVSIRQILTRGSLVVAVARQVVRSQSGHQSSSMTYSQVLLVCTLMHIQSLRRLVECLTLLRPSKSQMPLTHYILGFAYYIATNMSLWIEGSPAILSSNSHLSRDSASVASSVLSEACSVRRLPWVILFALASLGQNRSHVYLFGLRKYTLPTQGLFRYILCPHYLMECLIYVAFSALAAPRGSLVNKTVLHTLMFVVINLSITADGARKWYASKFGLESVRGKARIMPGLW